MRVRRAEREAAERLLRGARHQPERHLALEDFEDRLAILRRHAGEHAGRACQHALGQGEQIIDDRRGGTEKGGEGLQLAARHAGDGAKGNGAGSNEPAHPSTTRAAL